MHVSRSDAIDEGSYVLLYFNETINYVIKARRSATFNTIKGTIMGGIKWWERSTG